MGNGGLPSSLGFRMCETIKKSPFWEAGSSIWSLPLIAGGSRATWKL